MAEGRIKRGLLAHYLMPPSGEYERLGKDLEEYSLEMNAEVNTAKNIWDESTTTISGYEKQGTVAPYYCEYGNKLYEWLQSIIDEGLKLTEVETKACEVRLWEGAIVGAIEETVMVEVTSYGGDTEGYRIEFNLHYKGDMVKGTWNPTTKKFIPSTKMGIIPKEG